MKKEFMRIIDGIMCPCYLVEEKDGYIYYGHIIPGHENKKATAVMVREYYDILKKKGLLFDGENRW